MRANVRTLAFLSGILLSCARTNCVPYGNRDYNQQPQAGHEDKGVSGWVVKTIDREGHAVVLERTGGPFAEQELSFEEFDRLAGKGASNDLIPFEAVTLYSDASGRLVRITTQRVAPTPKG